jgi:hypothetical protein
MGMIMSAQRRVRARWLGGFALMAAVAAGAWAPRAAAEVRVSEAAGGRFTVEAHDATVRQIIEALSASRPIKLHTTDALARTLTGTYSGSVSRILARILDGYDHVVHATSAGIELDVVAAVPAARATTAAASATSTVTMVPNAARGVSSNVDLDEETTGSTRSLTVNMAAPPIRPVPSAPPRSAQVTGAPRISGNLDLDDETSR